MHTVYCCALSLITYPVPTVFPVADDEIANFKSVDTEGACPPVALVI